MSDKDDRSSETSLMHRLLSEGRRGDSVVVQEGRDHEYMHIQEKILTSQSLVGKKIRQNLQGVPKGYKKNILARLVFLLI